MELLLTGAFNYSSEQIEKLKESGFSVTMVKDERIPLKQQNVDPAIFEAVVCNGLFLYNDIKEFEKLKFIQLTSAGFDRVPLEEIKEKNIKIFNARGVYSIPMAEFALCGVLQLYKKSDFFLENQKEKKWEKNRELLELYGKNVCIVGCGSVGTECAKRFSAFGCKVYGVDISTYESEFYKDMVTLDKLDDKLTDADIVILTLPLTVETENLFDEKRFENMKENSVLVNIARGKIASEEALIKVLDTKLYGAVLDVFYEEPLSEENPLWEKENVILTPHNSFVGEGNGERLFEVVYRNLKDIVKKGRCFK